MSWIDSFGEVANWQGARETGHKSITVSSVVCFHQFVNPFFFFIVGSGICTFIQQTLGVSIVPALLKGLGNTLVSKIPACIGSHSSESLGSWNEWQVGGVGSLGAARDFWSLD